MSTANPLVATAQDDRSAVSGAFLVQDADDIASAIRSGDWGAGALAATSGVLDTAAAIIDPIGTLIANGLGWVLDHIEPLKSWFDDFTGDAAEVAAFSRTRANVSEHMGSPGTRYQSSLGDLDSQSGAAIDAYLSHAHGVITQLRGASSWAGAMSTGLQLASTLVQMVHDIVRDAISQIVGTAISATTLSAVTPGFGLPAAMAQVGVKVSALVARIGRIVPEVIRALTELKGLLGRLGHAVEGAISKLRQLPPGAHRGAPAVAPSTPGVASRASRLGASSIPDGWRPLTREDIAALPIVRDGSHVLPDGRLRPNSWYQTGEHDYIYHTNENGHIDRFHADELQLKEHEGRLRHDPNTPGKGPEDHAGHLAGDWAGGSPHLDNLVSMLDTVKLREYGGLERSWRSVLNDVPPGTVSVDVRIVTDPSSGRPTQFTVDHVVNGIHRTRVFDQ